MKIKFCGAAQEVTGSAHLITLDDGFQILLDCGLYQGHHRDMKRFNEEWLFDPKKIDALLLSHGHIDHTGRVPKLWRDGFRGDIYSTHATRSLCSLMLLDSAKIQESDMRYYNKRHGKNKAPLYTSKDVKGVMGQFVGMGYERWFRIHPKVRVLFRDAGHILGSASIVIEVEENGTTKRIGFSGDIGRPNRPILRDPLPMEDVDYLICESTYGDREHTAPPAERDKFLEVIEQVCVRQSGKLLIPAFSIGRTQEIVYMLDQLATERVLPRIPVYVDSPLAVNGTEIYGTHPECYDDELNEYLLIDENPFGFNGLKYNRDLEFSKQLNHSKEACIIISASGMMNAGRVKHHLSNSIETARNGVLIVGYCSPHTPGGKLRDGADTVRLFGKEKKVKAGIHIMDSFSAHADRTEILEFVKNQRKNVREIFLVHGTLKKQRSLRDYLGKYGFPKITIPSLGQEFQLD